MTADSDAQRKSVMSPFRLPDGSRLLRFTKSKGNGDVATLIASHCRSLIAGIACVCLTLLGVQAMAATRAATIVLPSAPTRIERFAARELSKYLAAAAEVKTSIATDAQNRQWQAASSGWAI